MSTHHCHEDPRPACALLLASERGRAALQALQTFLQADATYSLDFENQQAVTGLMFRAFAKPSIREFIAEELAKKPVKIGPNFVQRCTEIVLGYVNEQAHGSPGAEAMAFSGFVVIYAGEAAGWIDSIGRRPSAWRPGCIAVDVMHTDRIFLADGGDYNAGAAEWRALSTGEVERLAWPE